MSDTLFIPILALSVATCREQINLASAMLHRTAMAYQSVGRDSQARTLWEVVSKLDEVIAELRAW